MSLPTARAVQRFLAAASTAPVGFMSLPLGTDNRPSTLPVARLDPVSTGEGMADMGDPHRTTAAEWQVTCLGHDGEQAMWLLDKMHERLFARDRATGDYVHRLSVDGRIEWDRRRGPWAVMGGDNADGIVSLVGRFTLTTSTL